MFNRGKKESSPLHQAIIDGRGDIAAQLKDSNWGNHLDAHGFNSLELAQLLGKKDCQECLADTNSLTIKVQLKGQMSVTALTIAEFEKAFKITYRPFLTFPSYQILEEAIRNCPYLLRFEWILVPRDEWEELYRTRLAVGATAEAIIKWIDPQFGYGLFAAEELPEKSFIGEYTGIVRRIDKKHPDLNGYCFHYPTRFWSLNYFAIDALCEGNILRFANHSNQPNLQPLWLVDRGVLHLIFIANRPIAKGEELTFDYGSDYWIHRKKIINENRTD